MKLFFDPLSGSSGVDEFGPEAHQGEGGSADAGIPRPAER